MGFTPSLTKFFGASVTGYSSSVGWGEQSSTVTINLVEDAINGDRWTPMPVGTPTGIAVGGFVFEGLVQRYQRQNSFQGNPVYEVTLTSPTEILAGVQVILDSFYQPVGAMPNLINAFGYWEDVLGYGGSLSNQSGMLWQAPLEVLDVTIAGGVTGHVSGQVGLKPAIEALTSGGFGDYGGPIQFRGYRYNVDLGGLPLPPTYYRVGGNVARSILDIVSELCDNGGYKYVVVLEGGTIKFRTVSLLQQPEIGQVANYVNSRTDVISKNVGVELRNDVTNAVLIGGDYYSLQTITNPNADQTIWPFWDFDPNGTPVEGQGAPEVWHEVNLNASPIADIMGSQSYHCTIPELRFAAAGNFDGWAAYIGVNYQDKFQTINLSSAIDSTSPLASIFPDGIFQKDLIDASTDTIKQMCGMNDSDYWTKRANRVFQFVQSYATDYFGRRFLIKIPFQILWKVEPETTNIVKSDEPTNDGGYQMEGTQPLGLSFGNEDYFLTDDGRMGCFAVFPPNYDSIDLSAMDPGNYVAQTTGLYVRATIDTSAGVVYLPDSIYPYCVIELSETVRQVAPDPLGSVQDIATALGFDDPGILLGTSLRHGDFPIRIAPPPYRPVAVALPMKSNRLSYGPWGTFPPYGQTGLPGKVLFERDQELNPWNYGDIGTMNAAAAAKLANAATNLQETETGSFDVAALPELSLVDSFVSGGPSVTGISVSIGSQGWHTSYEMRTYTRVFGAFASENAERLKRLGVSAQQIRRQLRAMAHRQQNRSQIVRAAQVGFMENTSRAVQQRTPHDVLYGRMSWSDTYGYRTQCSASTYPEAIANARGDKPDVWQSSAGMSLEGLLRPFSTNWKTPGPTPGTGDMPHYGTMTDSPGLSESSLVPSRKTLDPFGDNNDIDIVIWGSKYPGDMHTLKSAGNGQKPDYTNARLMGMRFPLAGVGYGYEYTGMPFPNQQDTDDQGKPLPIHQWSTAFASKYRSHPEKWKAGPVDLHYDMWRHVWTIPTILKGTLDNDLPTDGSSSVTITISVRGGTIKDKAYVWCDLGGPSLVGGSLVYAMYYQQDNKFWVMAAPCS